jgi:Zn-dependent protease
VSDTPSARPVREWPISPTFLALLVVWLACAVWMAYRPDQARSLVFPFVLIGFVISLCLHEFGHAVTAFWGGDRSVRESGYLTLDPLRYTDVVSSILFPILIMAVGGIGLPGGAVYVHTQRLRHRLYGSLVAVAGPLATAIVLALLLIVLKFPSVTAARDLQAALAMLAMLELTVLIFNLVPCPGLDGWGVIEPFLPDAVRRLGRALVWIGPLVLLVALFLVPAVNNLFWNTVDAAGDWIGLDWPAVRRGFVLFQFWR